jgi:dihydroneopterin aldolase
LTNNYKSICEKEQQVNERNPGHKSAFGTLAAEIRENCVRFTTQVSAVKVHIPKPKGAAKAKAKRGKDADLTPPKEEEE